MVTKNKLLKIKTYPRESRRRQILCRSSKATFLLNCRSSEREILNEEGQYLQWIFLTGFGLKTRAKPIKTNKITPAPGASEILRAHIACPRRIRCNFAYAQGAYSLFSMPQAHGICSRRMVLPSWAQFLRFSSFLGLCNLPRNLGT